MRIYVYDVCVHAYMRISMYVLALHMTRLECSEADHVFICKYVCMHALKPVCIHMYMCICVYGYMCINIYVLAHKTTHRVP